MKKIIPVLLFVLASGFLVPENADTIGQLRERLEAFNRKFKRAKLDLVFDQPKYVPGDTSFFRTLYVNAADLKPVTGMQIVYVELFDVSRKRIFRKQVLTRNGYSENAMILPEDLVPGRYELVAYSDWMENLDKSLFYRQDLDVVGKDQLMAKPIAGRLDAYPEGGNLVTGVENNVLFHLTGSNPSGTVVVRKNGEEIASGTVDASGLVEVKFTPAEGASYSAEAGAAGRIDLPATPGGFSMHVLADANGQLKIHLDISDKVEAKRKYFLTLINPHGVIWTRPVDPAGAERDFIVPADVPPGIAQLTLLDDNFNRRAERTVLVRNKSTIKVKLGESKEQFMTREKGEISMEVTDKIGNPLQGQFSTTIINTNLFGPGPVEDSEFDNLHLFSDISATFRPAPPLDYAGINRYLISQTCPWLDWKKINANAEPTHKVRGNLVLSGKASFLENGKPVPDSTQIMFFLQNQVAGYEIYTNSKGEFVCPILFEFAGKDEVFYSATHKGTDINDLVIRLDKPDSLYGFNAEPWVSSATEDAYGVYELRKNLIDKSFSYFSKPVNKKDTLQDPNAAIEDELQGADLVLNTSDYIIFPTMDDLIREVLRSVEHRKIRGRDIVRVYTTGRRPTNSTGPLYVIDGVLTKNPATFLSLKPADVLTIKLIKDSNKLLKFGSLGANGVILIRTRNTARKALVQENTFSIEGIAPGYAKTPATPVPASDPSIPDMRPCLYRNPRQDLDASGKAIIRFTTPDDVGTYKVIVRGLTTDGETIFAEEVFQVSYHQP